MTKPKKVHVASGSTKVWSTAGADMGEVVWTYSVRGQEEGELLGRGGGKKSDGESNIREREREDVSQRVGGRE